MVQLLVFITRYRMDDRNWLLQNVHDRVADPQLRPLLSRHVNCHYTAYNVMLCCKCLVNYRSEFFSANYIFRSVHELYIKCFRTSECVGKLVYML
jgi:hypothetical protein